MIGVVTENFVDPSWKQPTVCYGRIIGLDQDPTMGRSVGVVRTDNQYTNLDAYYFFPGTYWMTSLAVYQNSSQVGQSITTGSVGYPDAIPFTNTTKIYDPFGYTRAWDKPAPVPPLNTPVPDTYPLATPLMWFDRNQAITNPAWLLESPFVGSAYNLRLKVSDFLRPSISFFAVVTGKDNTGAPLTKGFNLGYGAVIASNGGDYNNIAQDYVNVNSLGGANAIGVDGVYLITAPLGYLDIPIQGPGAGAVNSALEQGDDDMTSLLSIEPYTVVKTSYHNGDEHIDSTISGPYVTGAVGGFGAGDIRYMALDTFWPDGNKYVTDANVGSLVDETLVSNGDLIWKFIGEVGGLPSGKIVVPQSGAYSGLGALDNSQFEAVAGTVQYLPKQFASASETYCSLLGDVFYGQDVQVNFVTSFTGVDPPTWDDPVPKVASTPRVGPPAGVNSLGGHSWVFKGRADMLFNTQKAMDDAISPYGVWSGVDLGDFNPGDVIMVAVDTGTQKIWFGKNGKWYDTHGVSNSVPGSKSLNPTMLLDPKIKYYPACSARWGHTKLQIVTGSATKYPAPGGFTPYNLITISDA